MSKALKQSSNLFSPKPKKGKGRATKKKNKHKSIKSIVAEEEDRKLHPLSI